MIRHLCHDAIDKAEWDRQLSSCQGPVWYAASDVLDVASPGWEALVDDEGACMPLTWKSRFGLAYLYQPFLLQQLGVFAPLPSPERTGRFLQAVPSRFRYWDIGLQGAVAGAPVDVRFTERTDLCLRLDGDAEAQRAGYGTNHRRNLRKALEAGMVVDDRLDPGVFLRFVLGSPQAAAWKLSGEQQRVFRDLLARHGGDAGSTVMGVRGSGGELLSAGWFMEHAGRSYFLKGLASEEGREKRAMFLLLDHHIATCAGRLHLLDLAGSEQPALARFYAGFGATRHVYLRALVNRLPMPVRWLKP